MVSVMSVITGVLIVMVLNLYLGYVPSPEFRHIRGLMGTVCIEGHEYYQFDAYAANTYAIKLDDSGKPVKCLKGN